MCWCGRRASWTRLPTLYWVSVTNRSVVCAANTRDFPEHKNYTNWTNTNVDVVVVGAAEVVWAGQKFCSGGCFYTRIEMSAPLHNLYSCVCARECVGIDRQIIHAFRVHILVCIVLKSATRFPTTRPARPCHGWSNGVSVVGSTNARSHATHCYLVSHRSNRRTNNNQYE